MFGSHHHERDAEYGVGACGEYLQLLVAVSLYGEKHLRSRRFAYPVALYLFERFAPLERVETLQKPLCVCGDPNEPLFHEALLHRVPSSDRQTVLHLVVGQYCAQLGAPVYHCDGAECQSVVFERFVFGMLVHSPPLFGCEAEIFSACGVEPVGAAFLETFHELVYRLGLACGVVVVVGEHLLESPLGPFVVTFVAGAYFAAPVERESYLVELFAVAVDVVGGGLLGVLARLYGVLLGGQSERVVTHGVEHVEPFLPLISRVYV